MAAVIMINHCNILVLFSVSYLLLGIFVVEGSLGVNWGRLSTQRMIPSMVVDMMLQNNITEVKTFSSSNNVLEAFAGSGITIAITLTNQAIKDLYTTERAGWWIADNVKRYLDVNVKFRYVYVGTQPLANMQFVSGAAKAVPTLENMQKALEIANITGVKATSSIPSSLLTFPITKPSMAEFKPEMKEHMFNYCSFLSRNDAPFSIDLFSLVEAQIFFNDTEFGYFENNSTVKFSDGDFFYNNIFEVLFDSMVYAAEKLGFHDLKFIVGSIGWPTDGMLGGNTENAERFHQGLAKFAKSQRGTPKRPGDIEIYLHNIADENAIKATGMPFMRHWGIYRFDGQPKFNLDFSGNERKIKPVGAVGITHMPKRWCVLDTSKIDPENIPFETLNAYYNATCMAADCSSMSAGASCSSLQYPLNYSYAFNAGFQTQKQRIQPNNSCDYGGFGIIVPDNPSTPSCKFPIEIIAAETTNFLGQEGVPSSAFRQSSAFSVFVIVQFMFVLFHEILSRSF